MFRSILLGTILAGGLAISASAADVVVSIRPPRAVVEKRPPAPGREYVWVDGYHRYEGNAYVWTPGRWEVPPHAHAHWVAHQWVRRGNGWVMVEGHWR
jgi:WXXGXW repeat (2 copies)